MVKVRRAILRQHGGFLPERRRGRSHNVHYAMHKRERVREGGRERERPTDRPNE